MNSSQLAPFQITMLIGGILLFLLAAGLRFVIRRRLDSFQINLGRAFKSNPGIAARDQQHLLVFCFLDFVRQSLGGNAQDIRAQTPPNQLAVEPESSKVFS